MKPEIVNNQRKIKIKRRIFLEFATSICSKFPAAADKTFTVAFVSDKRMRGLNKQFRGADKTTDVLSFPFEADEFDLDNNNLGDIIISAEQAARQATENNLTLENEIRQLILHGVLHLCGYDHETDDGAMNKIELDLREKLKI